MGIINRITQNLRKKSTQNVISKGVEDNKNLAVFVY